MHYTRLGSCCGDRDADLCTLQLALDEGAHPNDTGLCVRWQRPGETLLEAAVRAGDACIAETLLRNGADAGCISGSGLSLLHLAAKNGHANIVRMLLLLGARRNQLTRSGETALDLARTARQQDTTAVLKSASKNDDSLIGHA